MNQQCNHRKCHFATTDFLTQVFWRAPDHLAGQEDSDDQEKQQIDHPDAFAAVNTVQPHADERRQSGDRVETIVLGIHRAARYVHRRSRESRSSRRPEPKFFTLQISEMLIDRQSGDCGQRNSLFPTGCTRAGNRECPAHADAPSGQGSASSYQSKLPRLRFRRIT